MIYDDFSDSVDEGGGDGDDGDDGGVLEDADAVLFHTFLSLCSNDEKDDDNHNNNVYNNNNDEEHIHPLFLMKQHNESLPQMPLLLQHESFQLEKKPFVSFADVALFRLPLEILLHVAFSLDVWSVFRLACTCKTLNYVCHDNQLWFRICREELQFDEYDVRVDWKECFKSFFRVIGIAKLRRLFDSSVLRISLVVYGKRNRGEKMLIPIECCSDGILRLTRPLHKKISILPQFIRSFEIGLYCKYKKSHYEPIYSFKVVPRQVQNSYFVEEIKAGNFVNLYFDEKKRELKVSVLCLKLDVELWRLANIVLKGTINNVEQKFNLLKEEISGFEKLLGREVSTSLESLQDLLISKSKTFSSTSSIEQFLSTIETSSDTPLQELCCKTVGILHGKRTQPPWSQTKKVFQQTQFLSQFFYFSSLLEKAKYQRNKRILKFLSISSQNPPPVKVIPKIGLSFSVLLVQWFELLNLYYTVQQYQYSKYLSSYFLEHTEEIQEDIRYLHTIV